MFKFRALEYERTSPTYSRTATPSSLGISVFLWGAAPSTLFGVWTHLPVSGFTFLPHLVQNPNSQLLCHCAWEMDSDTPATLTGGVIVSCRKDTYSYLKTPKVLKLNPKRLWVLGCVHELLLLWCHQRCPASILCKYLHKRNHLTVSESGAIFLSLGTNPYPTVLPEYASNLTLHIPCFLMKPGKLSGHLVPLLVSCIQKQAWAVQGLGHVLVASKAMWAPRQN